MSYYIHIADPGFPDPPWPGRRRLGPYLTQGEAEDQAIDDLSRGIIREDEFMGIYEEDASEQMASGVKKLKAAVVASRVLPKADTRRRRYLARVAKEQEDNRAAFQALLPKGVRVEDLMGEEPL